MSLSKRDRIRKLLKGIETGDPESVVVVNEDRYVQHNPMTGEGSIGLAELFKRLARTSPRVEIVRIFEDGDYVFGHVEYDFAEVVTGFEVFGSRMDSPSSIGTTFGTSTTSRTRRATP